jgi:hypothetical protein
MKPLKLLRDKKEYQRRKNEEYRHELNSDFNLLRKWVPDTKNLTRPQLLKKTVNYIQELLNEKKSPMKCTPLNLTGLGRDSVPKITLHYYPKDSEEPHTTKADLTTSPTPTEEKFPDFNTVEEMKQWLGIDDNTPSPEEEFLAEFNSKLLPEEKLSPAEEEVIADFNLDLLGSPPEFNWTQDFRQYLEL